WTDPRLAFDPKSFGDGVARPTPDQVWTPELTVINAANLQRKSFVELSVRPDGKVKSIEFLAATVSSDYNLRKFPFDTQAALVIWEPLSAEVQRLKLVEDPATTGVSKDSYVTLSEWDIQDVHVAVGERQGEY